MNQKALLKLCQKALLKMVELHQLIKIRMEKNKKLDVTFITSQEDTVQFYENRGHQLAQQREQRREMNVGNLPRTGQNALADACVELKRIMTRELQRLVERDERNVTEADIQDIFRNFKQDD